MEAIKDIKQQVLQSTLDEIETLNSSERLDPCVICLDEISEKAQAMPCCHQNFDFLCLASWLEETPRCPLCKTEVNAIKYAQKSSTEYSSYIIKNPSQQKGEKPPGLSNVNLPLRSCHPRRRRRPPPEPYISNLNSTIQHRRDVYRKSLYSCHVGSNQLSRFQELTPASFCRDEHLVSRARTFIRRELRVFDFLKPEDDNDYHHHHSAEVQPQPPPSKRAGNAEFLLEYIVAILKNIDLKGSAGQAEDLLQVFLGRANANLFLHELRAWLRSPYDTLNTWDRHLQYVEVPLYAAPVSSDYSASDDEEDSAARRQQHPAETSRQSRSRRYMSPERRCFDTGYSYSKADDLALFRANRRNHER